MPELDGYGVLKILASNPQFATVPFIFLTISLKSWPQKRHVIRRQRLHHQTFWRCRFVGIDCHSFEKVILTPAESHPWNHSMPYPSTTSMKNLKRFSGFFELRRFRKKDIIFWRRQQRHSTSIFGWRQSQGFPYQRVWQGIDHPHRQWQRSTRIFWMCSIISPTQKVPKPWRIVPSDSYPSKFYWPLLYGSRFFALSLMKHLAVYTTILENGLVHRAHSSVRKK